MANLTTPLKQLNPSPELPVDCKTPPAHQNRVIHDKPEEPFKHTNDTCKCKPLATPDRLSVPKPFKYPERYTSPTDQIMSPISKGLLGKTRRGRAATRLSPSVTHSKIHELRPQSLENIGQMRLKMES
ncbi:hypothetical protein KSS87_014412 [Heliosperma pusillum]|nr:hypothetical protein KSS87_014412 [Heliosperma pusillum]